MPRGRVLLAAAALVVAVLATRAAVAPDAARTRRLAALEQELIRLQGEMDALATRERGLLGDVARLDASLALERARVEDATLRLRETEERLAARERELATIEAAQALRAPYLAHRIRELYKQGPAGLLARVLAPVGDTRGLDGLRYAGYLARRDARQLAAWRADLGRIQDERARLSTERDRAATEREEAGRSQAAIEAGRRDRAALLARIRGDREQHRQAIAELDAAAKDLGRLVDSFEDRPASVALDVRKFRGLLDWPAEGPVTAGFGKVIHPKFKTEVPHPGLDIDAEESSPFRAVFDGRVVYAASLHGYGLTAVVDHGSGVVSIYAHAGVLLVEAGQDVARGQELGRVGDTGSLRGPYLYFELRVAGKPADPAGWLRRR
jgi:murein hydrolase activator